MLDAIIFEISDSFTSYISNRYRESSMLVKFKLFPTILDDLRLKRIVFESLKSMFWMFRDDSKLTKIKSLSSAVLILLTLTSINSNDEATIAIESPVRVKFEMVELVTNTLDKKALIKTS